MYKYGLIGSTEWGEDFVDWIGEHAVAYVNIGMHHLLLFLYLILIRTAHGDSSVSGSRFYASGSPSLAYFLRNAAESIAHPTKPGETLWDARNDQGPLFGKIGEHIDAEAQAVYEDELAQLATDDLGVSVLGSGSDYTVFLQHIGVRMILLVSLECITNWFAL